MINDDDLVARVRVAVRAALRRAVEIGSEMLRLAHAQRDLRPGNGEIGRRADGETGIIESNRRSAR